MKELSDRLPAAENRNNKFKLTTQQGHIVMQKCIYNCFVQYDINRKIPLIDYTFRVLLVGITMDTKILDYRQVRPLP